MAKTKAHTAPTSVLVETPTIEPGRTANGALTLENSGSKFTDGVFLLPAMRGKNAEAVKLFKEVLADNPKMALRMLLWLRDIRGGIGERLLARNMHDVLVEMVPEIMAKLVPYLPEYGRWDDVTRLVTCGQEQVAEAAVSALKSQLALDIAAMNDKKSFSLLAKWLPSENTSSKKTCALAKTIREKLGLSSKEYRQLLSTMRKNLNILERNLSLRQYSNINFESIPSKAIKRYKKAFAARMDSEYKKYLAALEAGTAKINASTLVPPDFLKFGYSGREYRFETLDVSDLAQWDALPDYFDGNVEDILVMPDLSGSMYTGGSSVPPIAASVSLAVYCAQRNCGLFKNVAIGFGDDPKIIRIPDKDTNAAVNAVFKSEVGFSTNLGKALNLVLSMCRSFPDKAPSKLLVISDMEFNPGYLGDRTVFDSTRVIAESLKIKLPQIIFWNVNGRSGNIPVKFDQTGVALVGGYNPSILKTLLSAKDVTPIGIATELLMQPRYAIIDIVSA